VLKAILIVLDWCIQGIRAATREQSGTLSPPSTSAASGPSNVTSREATMCIAARAAVRVMANRVVPQIWVFTQTRTRKTGFITSTLVTKNRIASPQPPPPPPRRGFGG